MTAKFKKLLSNILCISLLCCGPVLAEKADSNKPVQLEADRITVDDAKKIHVLEGQVILTKGTLQIRTEKLTVSQDANGFQTSIAEGGAGGLARFRQKRDNSNDYVEGEAERLEHDDRNQRTDFHRRAWLKSGQDEVRGQFIRYDARTANYSVTNTDGNAKPSGDGRVRAVIQPRNTAPSDSTPPLRSNITLPGSGKNPSENP